MSTNTLKQALEIVYGDIKNINKRVKNLESASIGVLYTETTKSAVAYQDNVSANACPYALINIVGGMSYKSENLAGNPTITNNVSSNFDPIITLENLNLKANTTYTISFKNINTLNSGTRYYITATPSISYIYVGANSTKAEYSLTFTTTAITTTLYVRLQYTTGGNTGTTTNVMLNEGSTALPYQPYFEGIRDSAVTSVISKDSNNTALQTINIPSEIQALEGYGWGINDTCYNYIDLNRKKFIQKVGTRAYQSGDEEDTSVLTDLTTTYYELETPVETNISQYIDDNSIQISANGTITFGNTYQQAIPYEYLYLEKVGANNE